MDVKVITRHGPSNYGSLLQSISTRKVIESLGHECTIIDYQRADERGLKMIKTQVARKEGWGGNLIKSLIYILLRYPTEAYAQKRFDVMRQRYLNMTQRFSTHKQLETIKADVFMTGSDQVWGPTMAGQYDAAYFLSFVEEQRLKIAYAGSFGHTDFPPHVLKEYKSLLGRYKAITVRENTAVTLLNEMGLPCKGQVLDPTLLLNQKEWGEWLELSKCKNPIQGKYVLVYQIHQCPDFNSYARQFAHHVGLPLYRVSAYLHHRSRGGKFKYCPDVREFLMMIKNCTYLLTDSFHGTALSLIFHKDFIEFLPKNQTGSRNYSILQMTGLTDRIVRDYDNFSIAESHIDYNRVDEIIRTEREKSLNLLKEMLENEDTVS